MSDVPSALLPVLQHDVLRVQQVKEWGEILTGFEGSNRYRISATDATPLLLAGEVSRGVLGLLMRWFLKASRPFTMELREPSGALALRLDRPWRWWFSRLEVQDAHGHAVGAVQRRFQWFGKRYEVQDARGAVKATIHGPLFKPWTFIVRQGDDEVGRIQKRWSGFGKELFTDADSFGVAFDPRLRDLQLRQLLLAATFLIDFVHFENKG